MRLLVTAAIGAAFGLFHLAAAGPRLDTVVTRAGSITAFAQDGPLVAWFAPGAERCNTLHVQSLLNGLHVALPAQKVAQNVTCLWRSRPGSVRLAVTGKGGRAVWSLQQTEPMPFDYLLGASLANRKERRFQELAHTKRGVGLWLGNVSGDGATLVYGVAAVDYVDEAGCLTKTGSCALRAAGGGVFRIVGRQAPRLVPGTEEDGAVLVSTADGAVAYVPNRDVAKDGHPVAGADAPIQIVDATTGDPVADVVPEGVPLAIALSTSLLATLERTPEGLFVAWYDRATGSQEGSVSVPDETATELGATDSTIVYRVGRSIRAVAVEDGTARELATAAAQPVGLSIEGARVAWAENLKSTARIRALYLTP